LTITALSIPDANPGLSFWTYVSNWIFKGVLVLGLGFCNGGVGVWGSLCEQGGEGTIEERERGGWREERGGNGGKRRVGSWILLLNHKSKRKSSGWLDWMA
jgi:hypothetical protein